MSRVRADRYTDRAGTGSPTFSEGVNVIGISSLGITTVTGVGQTALTVNGDARITGVLTVGQGSVTIGSTNITTININNEAVPDNFGGANRNLFINPYCDISQRGITTTGSNEYLVDRLLAGSTEDFASTVVRYTREEDAPAGVGRYSAKVENLSAVANPSGSSNWNFTVRIEDSDVRNFLHPGTSAAKQCTVQFYGKVSIAGTYTGQLLYYGTETRAAFREVTFNQANTWEKKVITFSAPGTDYSDIQPNGDAAIGMSFSLQLSVGAGDTVGIGTEDWETTDSLWRGFAHQVNLAQGVGNSCSITAIQIEPGSVATPVVALPRAEMMSQCERYYQLLASGDDQPVALAINYNDAADGFRMQGQLRTRMRSDPDLVQVEGTNYYGALRGGSTDAFRRFNVNFTSKQGFIISPSGTSASTRGGAYIRTNHANAYIAFESEL